MLKYLFVASLLALGAGNAQAITYVGTRTVGDSIAQLSITTDDTIGTLARGNVYSWSITVTNGARTATIWFDGDSEDGNSRLDFSGSALSATATDLKFNFDAAANSYLAFAINDASTPIEAYGSLWSVQTSGATTSFLRPEEVIRLGFVDSNPIYRNENRSGLVTLASIGGAGAVPEPATWAMMLAGFGMAGAALRRRRPAPVFA